MPSAESHESELDKRSIGFFSQARALMLKNWAYQKRQKRANLMLLMVPLLMIIVLVIVNIAQPPLDNREKYDLECLENNITRLTFPQFAPFTYSGEQPADTAELAGKLRSFEVPYTAPSSGAVGVLDTMLSSATTEWLISFQKSSFQLTQCEVVYQEKLEENRDAANAAAAAEAGNSSNTAFGFAFPDGCLLPGVTIEEDTPGRVFDLDELPGKDAFRKLEQERDECIEQRTADVIEAIAALNTTESTDTIERAGLLGNMTFTTMPNAAFASLSGLVEVPFGAPLSLACSTPPLRMQMAMENDAELVEAVCWVTTNQDLLRDVRAVYQRSNTALQEKITAAWGEAADSIPMALRFQEVDDAALTYKVAILYNRTDSGRGNWPTLLNSVSSALLSAATGHRISVSARNLPQYIESIAVLLDGISLLDTVAGIFMSYILHFFMPLIVLFVTTEKEKNLLGIMKMMGLRMPVYWLVTYLFFLVEYMIMVAVLLGGGALVGMPMVRFNDLGLLLLLLFLWGNVMIANSLFLSVFFSRARVGLLLSLFYVYIVMSGSFLTTFTLLQDPGTTEATWATYAWIPSFPFVRGILWYAFAGQSKSWVTVDTWGETPLPGICLTLFVEWLVLLLLTWYLDNVLSVGFGVPRHPLFFLQASYWKPKSKSQSAAELVDGLKHFSTIGAASRRSSDASPRAVDDIEMAVKEPADVEAERSRIYDPKSEAFVRLVNLRKEYGEKVAVRNLTLGINRSSCLGLLGPNGAGKTSAINVLSGLFTPTSGTAFIGDKCILQDMDAVHAVTGVCPQFDVLWDDLTAAEHLQFYGRLKGLRGKKLSAAVEKALRSVSLWDWRNKLSKSFSGGMKRRLSVANSLIGDPLVVIMDEPSTGLDPASRHQLWDVIREAKRGKSVLLTTHSMEEAEVLCDTIGIMTEGQLRCIGSAPMLKARYGDSYALTVTIEEEDGRQEELNKFLAELFPSIVLLQPPIVGCSIWQVDSRELVLSDLFRTIAERKEELHIIDWGINETTLEEIFLKIAQTGELELLDMSAKAIEKEEDLGDADVSTILAVAEDVAAAAGEEGAAAEAEEKAE
eukprot:PLAT152.11.p1 GENE.PLAT152.11~~PLAT152.11.p1  ORF type:complete len:1079 (-),score=645.97 PLAT152.11:106-3342(-)